MGLEEDEHVKEIYAHFGLAMYLAQVLEYGIVNALVYTDLIPRRAKEVATNNQWSREFDDFMNVHFKHTFGKLIRTLSKHVSVPSSLEQELRQAIKLRNFLAHGFFRERSSEFMSFSGRESMLKELEEAQSQFSSADEHLKGIIEPYRIKVGLTDELLKKAFEEIVSKARESS